MRIFNNTQNDVSYWISNPADTDCGTIKARSSVDLPNWNKKDKVNVKFFALPPEPNNLVTPYTLTIPLTKPGMAVTIALLRQ